MAHELRFRHDRHRSVAEIVAQLRGEFAYVLVDYEGGRLRAMAIVARLERVPAAALAVSRDGVLAYVERIRSSGSEDVASLEFGDRPDSLLKTLVLPGEALLFSYASDEEQADAAAAIERCAAALDCDVSIV